MSAPALSAAPAPAPVFWYPEDFAAAPALAALPPVSDPWDSADNFAVAVVDGIETIFFGDACVARAAAWSLAESRRLRARG